NGAAAGAQYRITNPPSGRATGAAKLQTGTPSARPFTSIARPVASKTCHATDPPLAQAVPSVHAKSTSPFGFAASRGCLRVPASPGAATGDGMRALVVSAAP